MEKGSVMEYFLIDNGSLRAGSVLQMRKIAQNLSGLTGHKVHPFGLMHSHKVDPSELEEKPGQSMQEFFLSARAEQVNEICALPFFLGPSLAITDWLPENLSLWKKQKTDSRNFRILPPLYQPGDDRLAGAMSELCLCASQEAGLIKPHVAMVDHGTPLPEVNQVREEVGQKMSQLLAAEVNGFSTCAMERRPGKEYDFNDPLLENLLSQWFERGVREVVLSQFFLLPGRHAGPGGDLAQICQPFIDMGMNIVRAENLGQHPAVMEILQDRIIDDLANRSPVLSNQ
jgi:sirohydrochlorin ferrochelatase